MNISTIVGKYHWGYSRSATIQGPLRPDLQAKMKHRPSGSLLFTAQFPPQEMPRWHRGVIHSSGSTDCLHVGPTSHKCRVDVVHRYICQECKGHYIWFLRSVFIVEVEGQSLNFANCHSLLPSVKGLCQKYTGKRYFVQQRRWLICV